MGQVLFFGKKKTGQGLFFDQKKTGQGLFFDPINSENPARGPHKFCPVPYLGIDISAAGSFTPAIKLLVGKARKAMMGLNKTIMQFQIPVKNSLKFFHSLIQPILYVYVCIIYLT